MKKRIYSLLLVVFFVASMVPKGLAILWTIPIISARQASNNIDDICVEIMENHTVDGNPPAAQTGTPLKYIS
jgi:hypothetical protein